MKGWKDRRNHRADAGLDGGMRVPMEAETCPLVSRECAVLAQYSYGTVTSAKFSYPDW